MYCTPYLYTTWKTQSRLNRYYRVSLSGKPLATGEQGVRVLSLAFLRNMFFLAKLSLERGPADVNISLGSTLVKDQDSGNSIGQAETERIQKDTSRDKEMIQYCLKCMKGTQRVCTASEVCLDFSCVT